MKLALTTTGSSLDAPLDPRFGRAQRFLIYDLEAETYAILDNQASLDAAQGAGIQAAETVAGAGVDALITGHCGPRAFRVLEAAGIAVYTTEARSVAMAVDAFRAGILRPAVAADVQGHWA